MSYLSNITRVNLAVDGTINAVQGDAGFAIDGSNGRVMAQYPKCWVRITRPSVGVPQWWISETELEGFEVHPLFYQRGNVGAPADYAYIGAYEADLLPAIAGHKLHSRAGKQPITGGVIFEVPFDAGTNEPAVGDTVTTVGGDSWLVVGSELSSGAWDGSGVGKLWISKVGDDDPGWSDDEVITNTTQAGETVATQNGADVYVNFDAEEAEDYGNNIGAGWGNQSIWFKSLQIMAMMQDWGNLDAQTELGRGVVDLPSGIGFDGVLTGASNIESNLDGAGTGAGDNGLAGEAADGDVPVAWRWQENLWGNVWEFISGITIVDAEYRVVKPAGLASAIIPVVLGAGEYTASQAAPITADGYISKLLYGPLMKYLFIASEVTGSSSTFIPDYFYAHDAGEENIMLAGGAWAYGGSGGPGCVYAKSDASGSNQSFGGRAEFIPQG